ncbi:MAG: hypothetical protein PHS80_15500 [Methanothrix sp.]|nr:hypothetical protein [Methanothrix sp.]MDD4448363.1 hypothetical protein [Methanothrix sp.]
MKVAITTVGSKGPEDESKNEGRLKAGKLAMAKAKSLGADILVLPGGFVVGNDFKSRQKIAYALTTEARGLELAVVFGVDDNSWHLAYGYAWSPVDKVVYSWEERSSTRSWNKRNKQPNILTDNQWEAKLKSYDDVRLLTTVGGVVGVLLCGELFNERIRNALIKRSPKIAVDLIHRGHGFRSTGAMKRLCHYGIASACSAHVQKVGAMKRCYIPGKGNNGNASTIGLDARIEGPPRIELKLFEV